METKRTEAKIVDLKWRKVSDTEWIATDAYRIIVECDGYNAYYMDGHWANKIGCRDTLAQAKACAQVHAA